MSTLYQAIVNTSVPEVNETWKGSATVEKKGVSKVAQAIWCKISLNRKRPSKNIYDTKGACDRVSKKLVYCHKDAFIREVP